jgi:hypothetical protein
MNEYLPVFHKVTKFLTWIVIFVVIIGAGYLIFVSANSLRFTPERIVTRFVSLIENPTQTVTESEKEELRAITQSGFFADWGNENNIKTLRRVSQGNPITSSDIQYTGESRRTAQTNLTFENDFTNEDSKTATLYLERIGNFWSGIRWQIFKIDMPREDNPIDEAREFGEDIQDNINEGTQNIVDRIRNVFQ